MGVVRAGQVRRRFRRHSPLNMTGYTTPAPFVVTDSGGYYPYTEGWRIFDNDPSDNSSKFGPSSNNVPAWVQIDFGTPKSISMFRLYGAAFAWTIRTVKDFEIYSDAGVTLKFSGSMSTPLLAPAYQEFTIPVFTSQVVRVRFLNTWGVADYLETTQVEYWGR